MVHHGFYKYHNQWRSQTTWIQHSPLHVSILNSTCFCSLILSIILIPLPNFTFIKQILETYILFLSTLYTDLSPFLIFTFSKQFYYICVLPFESSALTHLTVIHTLICRGFHNKLFFWNHANTFRFGRIVFSPYMHGYFGVLGEPAMSWNLKIVLIRSGHTD